MEALAVARSAEKAFPAAAGKAERARDVEDAVPYGEGARAAQAGRVPFSFHLIRHPPGFLYFKNYFLVTDQP